MKERVRVLFADDQSIGSDGGNIGPPTYDVNAHFESSSGRWFYRLNSVEHLYRQVIRPASYKTNLTASSRRH